MLYAAVKVLITSVLVVAVSELGRRSALVAALVASLPLVSVLGMIWLYVDTRDAEKVAALAQGIFWLVLPSLVLFVALPILLRRGFDFVLSMSVSVALTVAAYLIMTYLLRRSGLVV
jgi:hypothetical protein